MQALDDIIQKRLREFHGADCEITIHQPINAMVKIYIVCTGDDSLYRYTLPEAAWLTKEEREPIMLDMLNAQYEQNMRVSDQ